MRSHVQRRSILQKVVVVSTRPEADSDGKKGHGLAGFHHQHRARCILDPGLKTPRQEVRIDGFTATVVQRNQDINREIWRTFHSLLDV